MFFDNFWILDWEIFGVRDVRLREAMQVYGVVMEGKKLERLELDWEIEIFVEGLRFLLRD